MPKKPLPNFVAPMQASPVKEPFDSPDWIFETKLEGYRAKSRSLMQLAKLGSGLAITYHSNQNFQQSQMRLIS
jgi:bifunctional non-homologous end joining protein LigD